MGSHQLHPSAPWRAATPEAQRALRLLLGAAAAVVALASGLILWFAIAQPLQVLPRMRPAPSFALVAEDGRTVRTSDLLGRPALISFGASGCGPACAASEGLMRQVMARLSIGGAAQSATLITISLDPQHDTPAALLAHAARTPGRRWLSGRPDELKALVGGEFGVYYALGPGGLEIDERVVLLDAGGLVRAEYEGSRLDPERVLRDLALLREEAGASGPLRTAYEASHLFLCYVD